MLSLCGNHRGQSVPLRRWPFVIGRGADAQLRPRWLAVARRHCTVTEQDGMLVVEGSEAETYLDGVPVVAPVYAGAGSVLQVGPLFFKFCWSAEESEAAASVEELAGTLRAG